MSSTLIADLWISAEHWEPGQWRPTDDLVDILVTLTDGTRWTATICSFEHVDTLRARWARSGECLGGRYLWSVNLILAADTSRPSIQALLEDLLANGDFRVALGAAQVGTQFVLEERRISHAAELFEVLRDERLYEFLEEKPPASVSELAAKLARSESRLSPDGKQHWLNWVIRMESGALAGYVQATVEETREVNVAYVVSPRFQGLGIATQAVRRMLEIVAAQHDITAFLIVAEAGNTESLGVAQRLGFVPAPPEVAAGRTPSPTERVYWKPVTQR